MKKLLVVVFVFLMLLSIVGCNKNSGDGPSSASVDAVKNGDVVFTVPDTVFEEGAKVTAEKITAGEVYERAKTAVSSVAQKFTVFEFNAVKDEAKVQPNGKLAVTFHIPEGYSNNVKILYVADDGTTEEITSTINAGERTVVAELSHFSTYVLVDLGSGTNGTTAGGTADVTTVASGDATVTTVTTTATTAKPAYSAFAASNWLFRTVVENGDAKFCRTYTLILNDDNLRCGESSASPYEEIVPPEYQDQQKPSFEFDGIEWLVGAGGYEELSSFNEKGNTITFIDSNGKTLVLTRTADTTAKVVSNETNIPVKAGDVFTAVK